MTRPLIPRAKRLRIYWRDNMTCVYCGEQPPSSLLTLDHLVPLSRGGSWHDSNLVTCCYACNQAKGAHLPDEVGMAPSQLPSGPAKPTTDYNFDGWQSKNHKGRRYRKRHTPKLLHTHTYPFTKEEFHE